MQISKKALFFIPLLVALYSSPSEARIYFDIYTGVGMGGAQLDSDARKPTMGNTTVGGSLGFTLWKGRMRIGAISDYRFITQYTDTPSSVGNRRGSYFNVAAPTIGYRFRRLLIMVSLMVAGDYKLTNTTVNGEVFKYQSPFGVRTSLRILRNKSRWQFGAFGEYITFGSRNVAGTVTQLTEKLAYYQVGLTITMELFKPRRRGR